MTDQVEGVHPPRKDLSPSLNRQLDFSIFYETHVNSRKYKEEQYDRLQEGVSIVPNGWLPFSSGMKPSALKHLSPNIEPSEGGYMKVDKRSMWTFVYTCPHKLDH